MIDIGWRFYPALRALCALAGGILHESERPCGGAIWIVVLALILPVIALAPRGPLFSMLAIFASGALMAGTVMVSQRRLVEFQGLRCEVVGTVRVSAASGDRVWRTSVDLTHIRFRGRSASVAGRCDITIEDANPQSVTTGMTVSIHGLLSQRYDPGTPDVRRRFYLRAERGDDMRIIDDAGWLDWSLEHIRQRVRWTIRRTIGGEAGGVARGLLLGERSDISDETMDLFRRTGTIHVLALSGMHVVIIAMALSLATSRIGSRGLRLSLFVVAIAGYTLLVGAPASIVRAVVMTLCAGLSRYAGRTPRPLNTLCLSAVVVLAIDPGSLFDVSLLLSLSAVAGIILFSLDLLQRLSRNRRLTARPLVAAVAVAVGAQLGTMPVIATTFGLLQSWSIVTGLVVVPATTWGMAGALGSVIFEPVSSDAANALGAGARVCLEFAISTARAMLAALGDGDVIVHVPIWGGIIATVLLVTGGAMRVLRYRVLFALGSIACLAVTSSRNGLLGHGDIVVLHTFRGEFVALRDRNRIVVAYDSRRHSSGTVLRTIGPYCRDSDSLELRDVVRSGDRGMSLAFGVVVVAGPGQPCFVKRPDATNLVIPIRWERRPGTLPIHIVMDRSHSIRRVAARESP